MNRPCGRKMTAFQLLLLTVIAGASPSLQQQNGARGRSPVQVTTASGLLDALAYASVEYIELTGDVTLTPADVEAYKPLPLHLEANRSLTIASAGPERHTLDFGGTLQLLYLDPGSRLTFSNLAVQGAAPPSQGQQAGLPTVIQGAQFWPTVDGAPGSETALVGVDAIKVQNGCTPTLAANQANTFRKLLGRNDTVSVVGTTITIQDTLSFPAPVVDSLTKGQVGVAPLSLINYTVTCQEDPAAQPSSPPLASPSPAPAGTPVGTDHGQLIRRVFNAQQFLAALESGASTIQLEDDVFLTPASAQNYTLPFVLEAGDNLTVASKDGAQFALDMGGILQLLSLESVSHLFLRNLVVQGAAAPSAGYEANIPTEVRGSPFWPTIDGYVDHEITAENVTIRHIQAACTPELTAIQAQTFKKLLGRNDTVTFRDTTIDVADTLLLRAPITDRLTKEQYGKASYLYSNFSVSCTEDPAALPADGSASDTGSSSSSHSWLWPVIGTLIGLAAVGFGTTGLLLWRRQRRRRRRVLAGRGSKCNAGAEPGHGLQAELSAGEESLCKMELGQSSEELEGAHHLAVATKHGSSGGRSGAYSVHDGAEHLHANLWHTRVGVIEGLELGELLGRGSFGRAYRGRWNGAIVAVKIIEQTIQAGKTCDLSREPLLSMAVSHPNVVITHKISVVLVRRAGDSVTDTAKLATPASSACNFSPTSSDGHAAALAGATESGADCGLGQGGASSSGGRGSGGRGSGGRGSGGRGKVLHQQVPSIRHFNSGGGRMVEVMSPSDVLPPGDYETWMVLEYCDKGSLTDAVAAGKFVHPTTGELDSVAAALTFLDVAQGMAYMHQMNMLHGDLKGRNVLLRTARNDRRGFVCKLADFGLSRMLGQEQTHVETRSFGTATHAAPELLQHGIMTKAADVYAMALLMWELVAGKEAYDDLTALQIIVKVTQIPDYRPPIPEDCPEPLAQLIQQCWAADPGLRPTFDEIVVQLRGMVREFRKGLDRSRSEPVTPMLH